MTNYVLIKYGIDWFICDYNWLTEFGHDLVDEVIGSENVSGYDLPIYDDEMLNGKTFSYKFRTINILMKYVREGLLDDSKIQL